MTSLGNTAIALLVILIILAISACVMLYYNIKQLQREYKILEIAKKGSSEFESQPVRYPVNPRQYGVYPQQF
jgi:hypothetical protein